MTFGDAKRIGDLLDELGGSPEEIVRQRELWELQRAWRAAFAPEQKSWSGDLGKLDWHIFSYGLVLPLEAQAAIDAYESLPSEEIIVAVSLDRGPAFRCRFKQNPKYDDIRPKWPGDLYLVSIHLEWTFVITHEELCGPYYTARFRGEDEERALCSC